MINNAPVEEAFYRIFEVGCGAGFSTLALAIRDFSVMAIDFNESAINSADKLLLEHNWNSKVISTNADISADVDVFLWKVDLIHDSFKIRTLIGENGVFSPDLIVLCNPGGQLTANITNQEKGYLVWGGFSEEEILCHYSQGNVALLHKWAMIYAACGLAQLIDKPLLIIERGTRLDVQRTLEQIKKDTAARGICQAYRMIRKEPEDGIKLGELEERTESLYWGAGLLYPS